MPEFTFRYIERGMTLEQVIDNLASFQKELTFLLQNLDDVNVTPISGLIATTTELNKLSGVGAIVSSGTTQTHVADPSGGATQDAEARLAINDILASLEEFKVLSTS